MGYLVVLLAFAGTPPFLPGLALVALGESLRTWSAGILRKGEALATQGPYRFTRNPLYLGSLLSAIGLTALAGNFLLLPVTLLAFGLLYHGMIKREERALILQYGEDYRNYLESVPRYLLPISSFPPHATPARFTWQTVLQNGEHRTWLGLAAFIGLLVLRTAILPPAH